MFEKFENCKRYLDKQYARSTKKIDEEKSKTLYQEIQNIYYNASSLQAGKGMALKHYFENTQLFINPYDIFTDMADFTRTPALLQGEQHKKNIFFSAEAELLSREGVYLGGSDFGHTSPDWDIVFSTGIHGILNEAKESLTNEGLSVSERDFYTSVKYAYEGILTYIARLSEAAEKEDSPNARFALENLKKLTKGKPQTTAEAMQLYFIYYAAQHCAEGENVRSLGSVDSILYPFYKHDIENNIFTEAEIRELIKYFLYKWNSMEVQANIPFNLCTDTNELTYIILEEYIKLDIYDPKIHIKCSDKLPTRVYEMVMDSIRSGKNSFVYMNSPVVHKALMNVGIEENDAKNYTVIGCYEPSADGKEIPCTLSGRINLPLAVEAVLNRGKKVDSDTVIGNDYGECFDDFNSFYSAIKNQFSDWSEQILEIVRTAEREYPLVNQAPILSGTYKSCMESGTDAYAGGAKYNNSSVCAFGLATFTDELLAIKKSVFEEKIITLDELKKVLKNNWHGSENLRKTMMDKYPKYGNNNEESDELAIDIEKHMSACINNKPNARNGVFRMGFFSIDWIIGYGKALGASADGRYAGEPISKNICSSVGMDKNGVTGMINSAAKLDYTVMSNGTVLDLAIHPSAVSGSEGIKIMIALLKLYFSKGGYAVHINVLDAKKLRMAQENPEKYKNLQVRLCGWNVYFTDLDKEMQDNLIKSMED